MRVPSAELLQAMASVGLHPKQIQWDGKMHRYSGIGQQGRGDNGWIRAFVDQRGAIFGDNRTKQYWKWPSDDPAWRESMKDLKPLSAEEVRVKQAKADAQREKDTEKATKIIRALWDRAKPCTEHPYLEGKGIADAPYLRGVADSKTGDPILLIPMRNADGELVNIQRIWPDGTRLQMWQPGGSVGLYNTIGAKHFETTGTLYVCEGWATGWTIHLATECAVIVAFFDGGLETVGKILQKKFSDATLIFCADNDRWKAIERDGKDVNPGVLAARAAAKACEGTVAIPEFAKLEGKPTDYDDLRRSEDLDAVRRWLDPKRADKAVTEAWKVEPEPEPEPEEEVHWTDSFPSRLLGGLGPTLYFIPSDYGQIVTYSSVHSLKNNLLMLAPKEWYAEHFPRGQNVDWVRAVDAIVSESKRIGTYQPGRLRGRGVWRDDEQPLVHLGDRLLPPHGKKYIAPETYTEGGRIYPQLPRLEGPARKILPVASSRWVLSLFESLLWENAASAALCAGWTALAPLCGLLLWRPNIWLTGVAGCGKTTVLRDIIVPLLGGMGLCAEGSGTTEPGLRQQLKSDALPVVIDEAEADTKSARGRVEAIIRMIRSAASTSAKVYKGTQGGGGMNFEIRSMFCLGAVGGALERPQDKQRITILHLRHPSTLGDAERQDRHWQPLQRQINKITPLVSRMLVARSLAWARSGRLEELLAVTRTAAAIVLGSRRAGDQYGTLLAGTFTLLGDDVPSEEEAVAYMKDLGLEHFTEDSDPEGRDILDRLFQVQELVPTMTGTHKVTVGEMVGLVIENPVPKRPKAIIQYKDAKRYIKKLGFIVHEGHLHVANQSRWIRKQLLDTSFADGWFILLRGLAGAKAGPQMWFSRAFKSRTTMIPLSTLAIERSSYDADDNN